MWMDQEKLIECLKQLNFLYNQEDKCYSDNEKKEMAWKEIGKTLQNTGFECKKRWNNFRDSFQRALKIRKHTKGDQAANNIQKYLLSYVKEREAITSVNVELGNEPDRNGEERSTSVLPEQEDNYESATQQNHKEEQSSSVQRSPSVSSKQSVYSNKERNQPDTICTTLNYIANNKKENADQGTNKPEDMDLFFSDIAAIVKKLSPYNQALAKARIFSAVSQLEIEEISTFRPVSTHSSYSSEHSLTQPTQPPSALQSIQTTEEIPFYGEFASHV